MLTEVYKNALTEVFEVINYLDDNSYNRIPKEVIQGIEANRNRNYKFFIDKSKPLAEQKMLPETRAILFNFFRDYWCTEEQKEKIISIQNKERIKLEQEKREKFNPDIIFNNEEKINIDKSNNNINTALIENKKTFFKRIKCFIFKILHIV